MTILIPHSIPSLAIAPASRQLASLPRSQIHRAACLRSLLVESPIPIHVNGRLHLLTGLIQP